MKKLFLSITILSVIVLSGCSGKNSPDKSVDFIEKNPATEISESDNVKASGTSETEVFDSNHESFVHNLISILIGEEDISSEEGVQGTKPHSTQEPYPTESEEYNSAETPETTASQEPREPDPVSESESEADDPYTVKANSTNAEKIISYGHDVVVENNANQKGSVKVTDADLIIEDYGYVTGDITIYNGKLIMGKRVYLKGYIQITNGDIEIYSYCRLYKDIKITNGDLTAEDTNQFQKITISGGDITIDDNNDIDGDIYAPYSKVRIGSSNNINGNIIARYFYQSGSNEINGDCPE